MNTERALRPFYISNTQKNVARIGCAMVRHAEKYELFFLQEETSLESINLVKVIEAFMPALLGVLELHRIECGPIDLNRGDNAVALQTTATAALNHLLEERGQQGSKAELQHQFSRFAGQGTGTQTIHKIHHVENTDQWRQTLRPVAASLGGLSELETRIVSRAAFEKVSGLHWLPNSWHADTSSSNLLVVQAFDKQVQPRLAATGVTQEQVAARILSITEENAPTPLQQQLGRVAGLAEKSSFLGISWKRNR